MSASTTKDRTTARTTASHIECLRGLAKVRDGFAQFERASRMLREELLRCGRFQQANDVEKVRIQVEEMGGTPAVDRARQRLAFCFGEPVCTGGTPVPPGMGGES